MIGCVALEKQISCVGVLNESQQQARIRLDPTISMQIACHGFAIRDIFEDARQIAKFKGDSHIRGFDLNLQQVKVSSHFPTLIHNSKYKSMIFGIRKIGQ